jgi:hypothetical protein
MKIILTTLTFLLLASNSYALNLGDSLKQVAGDQGKQINETLDKKLDKVVKDYEEKVDSYKKEVDGEIAKYKAQVKEAEDAINKLKDIKAKAGYYINLVKTILALLSSGILVLIFVMWRIWRNIVNMKKLLRNVTNYDDFNERLKKVEKLVATKQ